MLASPITVSEILWFSIRINIHILLILESKECCPKVRLVGAHDNDFDIIYTKENELLNGMPYYVDDERLYAIWFDGTDEWMIGYFSYIQEGKFTWGFFQNDEYVDCPADTNDWHEVIDNEWKANLNAKLACEKDTN